jgi:uncharacterized membrane protein YkvA (DUF1232 family)
MLINEVKKVLKRIDKIDLQKEMPTLAQIIWETRPDVFENVRAQKIDENAIALIARALAGGLLKRIKEIPEIVRIFLNKIEDKNTSPSVRCALLGSLAYLVEADDLIPDNAPGGYGFIDDALILRVSMIEYLNLLPPNPFEIERERRYVEMISGMMIPLDKVPAFEALIVGLSTTFQILSQIPEDTVNAICEQLLHNPHHTSLPSAPPDSHISPYILPTAKPNISVEGRSVHISFPDGGGTFMDESGNIIGWEK